MKIRITASSIKEIDLHLESTQENSLNQQAKINNNNQLNKAVSKSKIRRIKKSKALIKRNPNRPMNSPRKLALKKQTKIYKQRMPKKTQNKFKHNLMNKKE
jgi:hypothetical protein